MSLRLNQRAKRHLLVATAYILNVVVVATHLYASPYYWKQPYHNSKLSGAEWVKELINGHPDRIWTELGLRLHAFLTFVHELRDLGSLEDSRKGVTGNEQAAIFLYMCVTGLSVQHVGERFQCSNETITRYFQKVLHAISSGPFYNKYVRLPKDTDAVPEFIRNQERFYPFFKDALGAINGTHLNCCPSAADRQAARNRKGGVTQNCLAAVSFSMRFLYMLSGWEGSTADATMFNHSRRVDFRIPLGKYYLADAGFGICDSLMVPYRGVQYHLAEWGRANTRPQTKEELYNLQHTSARNVVERIFGIVKKKWGILTRPPHFPMSDQAEIPPAIAALHNFIMDHDPNDLEHFISNDETDLDPNPGAVPDIGSLSASAVSSSERERATALRDHIVQEMWAQYQEVLADRAAADQAA